MSDLRKKNILFLTHDYFSFQKKQIESVSKYFNKVYVLVRFKPLSYLSYIIPVNRLKHSRKNRQIDTSNKPENINIITVPLYYWPTDAGYKKLGMKHYNKTKKIIKRYDIEFDIIHAHYTYSAGFVGYMLKKIYKTPLVITGHGYDVYQLPFKNNEWREKITTILRYADRIFTNSIRNKSLIKKIGVNTKIQISPTGVNDELFFPVNTLECRKKLNLPNEKKILVSVGSFVEVKGQKYLIDAIKEILIYRNDILCILVGGGRLERDLRKRIKKLGLSKYIKLIDKQKQHKIPLWINSSDIFVLPSLNEGMPDSMFEALACGKPFVGTKVGGIPEVINNEIGLLVEPGSVQDLTEKIMEALNKEWDNSYINEFSQQYTTKRNSVKVSQSYRDLL